MNRAFLLLASAALASSGCDSGRTLPGGDAGVMLMTDGNTTSPDTGPRPDTGTPSSDRAPGQTCSCDSECAGTATHPGLCVEGICMMRASAECASGGSTAECPSGSRCWGYTGFDVSICWPDCAAHECAGECDSDGSCVPTEATTCDASCAEVCDDGGTGECPPNAHPEGEGCVCDDGFVVNEERTGCVPQCASDDECSDGSLCVASRCVSPCSPSNPTAFCADPGQACDAGACVDVCSSEHPGGRCPAGATCVEGECRLSNDCPVWQCEGRRCAEIVAMPGSRNPADARAMTDGYYVSHEARYSYLRADIAQIFRHSACETARRFAGTPPLATGDLSQADGQVPGTDVGSLRHPSGTHTGADMDLAYYQTDGSNNLQIICGDGSDTNGNGVPGTHNDGYYCTSSENIVDVPRQAFFLAMMARNPNARVFGIDRTLAADLDAELERLLEEGIITTAEYEGVALGYDPPPERASWVFHHHHAHLSYF